MANIGEIGAKAGVLGGKAITTIIWVAVIVIVLAIVCIVISWSYKRKKWNLKVIVKMPRAGQ
ncbi:hypothetical protein KAT51_06065, partial [bacterium]|nr:hypothetical protein [bacterium]